MKQIFSNKVLNYATWAIVLLTALLLMSCGTTRTIEKPVVVERVSHDTLRQTQYVATHDTIFQRDSVFLRSDGSKDQIRYVYQKSIERRTDTVYIAKSDTVPKIVTETKVIEKKPNFLDKMKAGCAVAIVMLIIVVAVKFLYRRYG